MSGRRLGRSESEEIDEYCLLFSHSRNYEQIKFPVDKKKVTADSLDNKQQQTGETTDITFPMPKLLCEKF